VPPAWLEGPRADGRADDDRVVPLHSFKLAAALQHARPENAHPLLLRIEKKAGHGAGKSTEQRCVPPRAGGGVADGAGAGSRNRRTSGRSSRTRWG
jgi:hypothetical protein